MITEGFKQTNLNKTGVNESENVDETQLTRYQNNTSGPIPEKSVITGKVIHYDLNSALF